MRQAGNGRTAKAIWTPEPILTPERKLWRAVLEQAYEDAELPQCEQGRARIRARRYLRADSPREEAALKSVCEFAEVPADRLIPWARRRYPAAAAVNTVVPPAMPVRAQSRNL